MNTKWKTVVASSLLTVGAIGTVTSFAASNSTSTHSASTAASQWSASDHSHAGSHHGFGGGRGIGGGHGQLTELASILGIDVATLQSDLQSGQSIMSIAQTKGISEQTLVSTLQSNLKNRLDQAVQNGKMTSVQEQQMLTNFSGHATQFLEHAGTMPGHGPRGQGRFGDVSKILGVDNATLQTDLKAGQSLAQIAQSKGISEQTLITDLTSNLKSQLDQSVTAGKLTAQQEQQILGKFQSHVTQFVEHSMTH